MHIHACGNMYIWKLGLGKVKCERWGALGRDISGVWEGRSGLRGFIRNVHGTGSGLGKARKWSNGMYGKGLLETALEVHGFLM